MSDVTLSGAARVRVSVIIPAFNAERFLATALASVAAQTQAVHEVIVVDDASTDRTAEIANSWVEVLPLRVHQKVANEGLGAARATGIELSSGETIALLDADDCWLPDHLAHLTGLLETTSTIATPGVLRWTPGSTVGRVPSTEIIRIPSRDCQALEILEANFLFAGSVFSRTAYELAGGFRPMRKNEDWDLWIRMISNGCHVVAPAVATVLYRQHDASLSVDDGCLPHDIEMLTQLGRERSGAERRVVKRALRRRHARTKLVAGFDAAARGESARARRHFAAAAATDRSLRGGTSSRNGSVTLRAIPGLLRPEWAYRRRTERLADPDLNQAPGAHVLRVNVTQPLPESKELQSQ